MLLSVQWNQTKVSVLVCIQTNTGVAGLAITGGARAIQPREPFGG